MSRLTNLREFQQTLTKRIQGAAAGHNVKLTRLGVQAGKDLWLIELEDAAEVLAVGPITPVPLTRPWFRGLTNVRGNLFSVVDLGGFVNGEPTGLNIDARLVLINDRFQMNVALLVNRMLGLRAMDQLQREAQAPASAWTSATFRDAEARQWQQLSMSELVYHHDFMQVGL